MGLVWRFHLKIRRYFWKGMEEAECTVLPRMVAWWGACILESFCWLQIPVLSFTTWGSSDNLLHL